MKKLLLSLLGCATLTGTAYAGDEKITRGYNSNDSLGCMMLRECTDNVRRITSIKDIQDSYPNSDYSAVAIEFNEMLDSLDKIGVMVFLGDQKYFPIGNRGVYHTVSNNFFLNDAFMGRQSTLMSVVRHEGWHAAQDCMAGTIDNSMIAIILREDDVPSIWREIAEKTYPKSVVPWEAEASWAGRTENMTADALAACATGKMWEIYEPTPLTREYLVKEGYITK
jgi:hypothetical protein